MSKPPYATAKVVVAATDGTPVTLVVPTDLPSEARCNRLSRLYNTHVKPLKPGDHWKAECYAEVARDLATDVGAAMTFMGSIVDDTRDLPDGRVRLYSHGYWAHGF